LDLRAQRAEVSDPVGGFDRSIFSGQIQLSKKAANYAEILILGLAGAPTAEFLGLLVKTGWFRARSRVSTLPLYGQNAL
jgi:hypothetical protein